MADASTSPSHSPGRRDEQAGLVFPPLAKPQRSINRSPQGEPEVRQWWKFRMRGQNDDGDVDWWFASTAIPLIAATVAPLANVLSLAALVTYWRMDLRDAQGKDLPQLSGIPFKDPKWCYWPNVASLICGFVGNIFLLFNFTGRIRYIIALPMTIIMWYISTGILISLTICMHLYIPPIAPYQTYTQGFWYAVIAAILYLICSMLLMVNMLGYVLGHYPQHFNLTDHQRTLIIQTMLYFVWLAGGGAIFAHIESRYQTNSMPWAFVDGLYFCDVTVFTVGFGDLYPIDNLGRGLVFPFSVGGVIMLGLVVSSICKFAVEISEIQVVRKHIDRKRTQTLERTQSSEVSNNHRAPFGLLNISSPHLSSQPSIPPYGLITPYTGSALPPTAVFQSPKLEQLSEERDKFLAMRHIQASTARYKRWWRLTLSICAFGILWAVGAVVFWQCERHIQGMTYFQALYFSYVSLLTIGYGDLAPKSNAGRCFFVVWSHIAVPTITLLIQDLGNTIIDSFKKGAFRVADFTVLPKAGVWHDWLTQHPKLLRWLKEKRDDTARRKRLKEGMTYPSPDEAGPRTDEVLNPSLRALERQMEADDVCEPSEEQLARQLALAIRAVAGDLMLEREKRYTYEEWAELTRLIRFTSHTANTVRREEDEEGLVEWDWIGVDSPMMSTQSEPEFVLDRLCESLRRYMRRLEYSAENIGLGGMMVMIAGWIFRGFGVWALEYCVSFGIWQ
ncbi:voltage-gated potassium channel [Trichodelitschia bisporula]|uniref:Voltage-gated potassium channel n=1 Tax=Trichodelitschia bisporula TaxID=703511 RepID=A0A6G1I0Y2_9PEZI|nr:voltage-gated potassium channel [Trichodelitschia bisporula]